MVLRILVLFIGLSAVLADSDSSLDYSNFSFGLYKSLAIRATGESLVFSPLSIHSLLSLVYLGADGETADEMSKVLLVDSDKSIVANNYNKFLADNAESPSTKIANKIFLSENFEIKQEFTELSRAGFDSAYEKVDTSNGNAAAEKINTWVANKTNRMVQNLVEPYMVQDAAIVLVNAVHFKAKWSRTFNPEYTISDMFWISPGNGKRMQFMKCKEIIYYGSFDGFVAFKLYYRDSNFNIIFVLPEQDIQEVEEKVSVMGIEGLKAGLHGDILALVIPKFKTEFSTNLKPVLREMGIRELFEPSANLGKLADGPVFISRVVHKAVLEVDEGGTTGGAGSAGMGWFGGPRRIDEIRLDRPFLYYIFDSNNQIFFMGRFSG